MSGYSIDELGNLVAVEVREYNHLNHKKVIVHPRSNRNFMLHGLEHEPRFSIGAIGSNWTANAGDSFVPASDKQLQEMKLLV